MKLSKILHNEHADKVAQLEKSHAELLEVAKLASGLIEEIAKHTPNIELGSALALMEVKEKANKAIARAQEAQYEPDR